MQGKCMRTSSLRVSLKVKSHDLARDTRERFSLLRRAVSGNTELELARLLGSENNQQGIRDTNNGRPR